MVFNKAWFESKKFIAFAVGVLTDVILPLLQAHFNWFTPDMMHYILLGINALVVVYIPTQGIIDGATQAKLIEADVQKLAVAIAGIKSGTVKPEDIIAIAESLVVDVSNVIKNISTPDAPAVPPAPPSPVAPNAAPGTVQQIRRPRNLK